MFELVLQVLAYSGVGLVVLVVGFYVLDLLTPGKLGQLVMDGNPGAGLLAATGLASLGLIMYFAIHCTGAGWDDPQLVRPVGGQARQVVRPQDEPHPLADDYQARGLGRRALALEVDPDQIGRP